MIETYFGDIFAEIVLAVILGVGGLIIGYFRKISKTQTDLCNKVANLEKALIILCTALDRQTNRLHNDEVVNSDLQDLVRKIIKDNKYLYIIESRCWYMVEALVLVAVAAIIGAGLNTLRGYLHSKEPYSAKKLAGSIIIATFAALALSQSIIVEGLTTEGVALIGLVTGFSADYAITKAKK